MVRLQETVTLRLRFCLFILGFAFFDMLFLSLRFICSNYYRSSAIGEIPRLGER